jgi:hypothetical protein
LANGLEAGLASQGVEFRIEQIHGQGSIANFERPLQVMDRLFLVVQSGVNGGETYG